MIKTEIEEGWLLSVKDLISAEIFTDFIEMAEYLLDNDYKDAAAVIVGSTLESRLRILCEENEINTTFKKNGKDIYSKANRINTDLYKAQVYNKLSFKNITAWLEIRNSAAHGHYNEFTKDQVEIMLTGVKEFLSRSNQIS